MLKRVEGKELQNLCAPLSADYRQVLEVLQSSEAHLCLVTGQDGEVVGTITDGDCRRAFLKRLPQDISAAEIMNTRILVVSENFTTSQIESLMSVNGINQVPMVDRQNRLTCLYHTHATGQMKDNYETPVVLLAGGLGTRLRPLTENTPKPMIHVHGAPILERIVIQLVSTGFQNLFISVNYLAEQIMEYFEDGSKWGCSIKYLEEDAPLGTAGPLALLTHRTSPKDNTPVLVVNGDVFSNVAFDQLMKEHNREDNIATVGFFMHGIDIPYGVLSIDQSGSITDIKEKPSVPFPVSAGIYVLNRAALLEIPDNCRYDMPDLIRNLIQIGHRVGSFNIIEPWVDVGSLPQLRAAHEIVLK